MADRTLLICAGLVIVALLLFAGTGLLLMYKGTPGNSPAAGPFQKNDENMKSAAPGSPSEQQFQPGSRNDGVPCPGERINANTRNGPGPGCPCMENHGNHGPGNAPGSGMESGSKPGQDKVDCPMSHGNQCPGNTPGSGPEKGNCPMHHNERGCHAGQTGFDQKDHDNSRRPCQSEQDNTPAHG